MAKLSDIKPENLHLVEEAVRLVLQKLYDWQEKYDFVSWPEFKDSMTQYTGKVGALCVLWSFDEAIIEKVFLGLGGDSMDEADEYLHLMNAKKTNDPAECWEAWRHMHNLGHEPNPFKTEDKE